MKDNKLIADFMGVETTDGVLFRDANTNGFHSIKYHTSWDWLMPVVQKCYESGAEGDCIGDITMYLTDVDIQGTYDAVVEFIKLINTQIPS